MLAGGFPALYVLLEGVDSQPAIGGASGHGLGCFLFGSALSLPFVAVVVGLDRSDRPWVLSWALAGATGGLLANGALAVHCADRASSHLLASHGSVGAALALLGILAAARVHRLARRADRPRTSTSAHRCVPGWRRP
jgi:hypothetical protein